MKAALESQETWDEFWASKEPLTTQFQSLPEKQWRDDAAEMLLPLMDDFAMARIRECMTGYIRLVEEGKDVPEVIRLMVLAFKDYCTA